MRGQVDLLGEVLSRPEVGSEIVKIAREAAEKRRQAAEVSKQMRLDGTVPVCRGYAVYTDFEEYIKQRMEQEQLKVSDWAIPKVKFHIMDILCEARWEHEPSRGRQKARFYPPSE